MNRHLTVPILILCSSISLFGNESVVISEIFTEIEGKTRRKALLAELRIEVGREYESLEELETVLWTRIKPLLRRRLFREFKWGLIETEPGLVKIEICLVDSATFLPRPIIKYSSDRGITLGLKLEYFNAFGTLTDQMTPGYWSPDEIRFDMEVRELVLGPLNIDVDFQQFDGSIRYGSPTGNILIEYRETRSRISSLLEIPLGTGSMWSYHIRPFLSWQYNFRNFRNDTPLGEHYLINPGFAPGLDHGEESFEFCRGATAIIYIDAILSLALNVDWGWDFKRNLPELIIDTRHYL